MRLFVALSPPPEVLDDLERVVDDLRAAGTAVGGPAADLRWTTADQWHLTLTFLGEVDDRQLDELTRRIGRAAARHHPLQLQVGRGGGFGSSRAARVLWAGVGGDTQPLRRLADSTTAAARRTGLDVREGRFRPHLTLARLKQPADVRPLVERLETYAGPPWRADRLDLVRSHLGQGPGRRATYETIAGWPLGEPGTSGQE
ncbi:2'-5' RNA ligase family protein [Flindersiella endophytica]